MNSSAKFLGTVTLLAVISGCTKTEGVAQPAQQPEGSVVARAGTVHEGPTVNDQPAPASSVSVSHLETDNADKLQTYGYGPIEGPIWCIHNDRINARALLSKHLPPDVGLFPDTSECSVSVTTTKSDPRAGVYVSCGEMFFETLTAWKADNVVRPLPEVGERTFLQELSDHVSLQVWLTEPQCHVRVNWASSRGIAANRTIAIALAKDVIAALTPEALKVPRVDLIYTAEDTTGDAARAALERFKDRVSTVQTYAPLAPGYPRVARSEEFAGLPAGKQFLLFAICPGGWARTLEGAFGAALPPPYDRAEAYIDFKHYTTDGLGLPRACPETGYPDALSIQFAPWKVEGDRLLTAAIVNSYDVTTPGELRFRAAAFLYAKDGALLDTITVQEPYSAPQRTRGRYAAEVTKSYGKCKSLVQSGSVPKFTFGCEVEWEDQECSVKPFEGKSYYIKVSDDHRLSLEVIPGTQSGRCKPKGGFPVVEH